MAKGRGRKEGKRGREDRSSSVSVSFDDRKGKRKYPGEIF